VAARKRTSTASGGAEVPTARSVAAAVLARVDKDDAWAAAVLDGELERSVQLDARERALATELVFGTLRNHAFLVRALAANAPRGLDKLDPWTRAAMLVAAHQLVFLDRVPSFAAVNEAVGAIRRARGAGLAGFANAVLRKVASQAPGLAAARDTASYASLPTWLREGLVRALGEDAARQLVHVTGAPPTGLRVRRTEDRDVWGERLAEARPSATVERGDASPLAILVRGAGRLAELPGYGSAWTVQEEGSQVIALALGARAGDVVLDACAGRGHKTAVLAEAVGPGGAVDAADLHASKLDVLRAHLAELGLAPRAVAEVDLSVGVGALRGPYDRALVDAPCTGTGTLRRRPELALRKQATDPARMAVLGRSILARVASAVKPGGRVVYSVCSVLREEAEDALVRPEELSLRPAPFDSDVVRALAGDATTLRLLPHLHGTDGYFIASFERV
jgi:16S rRNA (cytosine967-C5)-methyltransferase